MTSEFHRQKAKNDFDTARKEAAMQRIVDRLLGRSSELIPFDEVKEKLGGIQGVSGRRKEIPIEAIVGSVGRYNDFNRDFLPRAAHDRERWVNVRMAMESPRGLPPIEVYQVGEAYFVVDGNHRVSIARRRRDTHIVAYVTEIKTRVAFSPDDSLEDVARKAETADFLEKTGLDRLTPDTDFRVTEFGQYALLLQQIEMVHFIEMQKRGSELSYDEAVKSWLLDYYFPVVEVIREQNLLRHYPSRTETDLYIWLLDNKQALSDVFGWDVQLDSVAAELAARQRSARRVQRTVRRLLNPEHDTGEWRERQLATSRGKLFSDVVVLLENENPEEPPLQNALAVAAREDAHLLGLVIESEEVPAGPEWQARQAAFDHLCGLAGVSGQLSLGKGSQISVLPARTRWADLAVLPRPARSEVRAFHRLLSKIRIPVWVAGAFDPHSTCLLLAFDGSPKSHEALFLSAYMSHLWGLDVIVLTATRSGVDRETLQDARKYLQTYNIEARYLESSLPPAKAILQVVQETGPALILTGSYQQRALGLDRESSTLDRVIAEAAIPVLICR